MAKTSKSFRTSKRSAKALRSTSTLKGWATRRANARRQAALKGWQTRRKNEFERQRRKFQGPLFQPIKVTSVEQWEDNYDLWIKLMDEEEEEWESTASYQENI